MQGTTTSVRTAGRLSGSQVAEAELDPAWLPWVRMLDIALASADDAAWADAVPELAATLSGAPLLHGTVMRVDARRVRQLVRALLREACAHTEAQGVYGAGSTRPGQRRLDALGVIRGAIMQDADAIERVAERAGADAGALSAVAQLASIPILRACATRFRDRIAEDWLHGYCPVCGAWPTLVEIRGLERNRRLRCGRCSSDWPIPVLRCPFCSEMNHGKLHALLPEGAEQTRRVDVCDTCKGYIKGVSTLQTAPLRALAITDLATIELDLVAQERGYERPAQVGFPLSLKVVRAGASGETEGPA